MGNGTGLREPFAEAAQRLFVEAWQWRAAKLVVDHDAHRVRPDVDDGIGRSVGLHGMIKA